MLCYLDGGVINHDELVSWRHHLCITVRSKNKSIDALKQHDALCKKYSTAGGADCSRQDFSIKPAVKNEWLWHLEAFSTRWTQPARLTLPISQHFNSPSLLLVLVCVLLLLLPPFVQRKSARGLLHMLDEERKQVGGKNLSDKVGQTENKDGKYKMHAANCAWVNLISWQLIFHIQGAYVLIRMRTEAKSEVKNQIKQKSWPLFLLNLKWETVTPLFISTPLKVPHYTNFLIFIFFYYRLPSSSLKWLIDW